MLKNNYYLVLVSFFLDTVALTQSRIACFFYPPPPSKHRSRQVSGCFWCSAASVATFALTFLGEIYQIRAKTTNDSTEAGKYVYNSNCKGAHVRI